MKLLVTGTGGQLGSELKDLSASYSGYDFIFVGRKEFPLEDIGGIAGRLDALKPDTIINAAAYTAVDLAETAADSADRINHLGVGQIADWCRGNRAKLVHLSTDYVFDGNNDQPIVEESAKNPINTYGQTKHLGEEAIIASGADAIIIRTAWVYSSYGKNFVKTMLRLMSERDEIAVVNDQIGSPTYAHDLAKAILDIVHSDKWANGVYNYSNEGRISWYDFAVAIRDIRGLACKVNGIPTEAYPTPAKRPQYSLLDKRKIKATFGVAVPDWRASLTACLGKLKPTSRQNLQPYT
ncbi:dTDP-4-dehydrorhamnose reductase [Parapedobacter luteus]|uniref:dTDP-4-dehydrorhamnose reductase n=1 Tax=Parapedobacter luteus TaxID=623280 RepID=A0A1T5DFT7_9SPHI|nr:dTDP-4-dehydrorhamnose reductase [Parapedobacter luteus]SKB70350.1 dTDP-4-dehydrorhamnose reductase [Parapedobacter luteus]